MINTLSKKKTFFWNCFMSRFYWHHKVWSQSQNRLTQVQSCIRGVTTHTKWVFRVFPQNNLQLVNLLMISALGISEALTLFFFPSLGALFLPPFPTTSHFPLWPLDAILNLWKRYRKESWEGLSCTKYRISRQIHPCFPPIYPFGFIFFFSCFYLVLEERGIYIILHDNSNTGFVKFLKSYSSSNEWRKRLFLLYVVNRSLAGESAPRCWLYLKNSKKGGNATGLISKQRIWAIGRLGSLWIVLVWLRKEHYW